MTIQSQVNGPATSVLGMQGPATSVLGMQGLSEMICAESCRLLQWTDDDHLLQQLRIYETVLHLRRPQQWRLFRRVHFYDTV